MKTPIVSSLMLPIRLKLRELRPAGWLPGMLVAAMLLIGSLVARADPLCDSMPVGLLGYQSTAEGVAYAIDLQEVETPEGTKVYAYVGDIGRRTSPEGVLNVFDVTDPCDPTLVVSKGLGTYQEQELGYVLIDGNVAYLAHDYDGFETYDISDPTDPTYLAGHKGGTFAASIAYDGERYAFVGHTYTGGGELKVYDMDTFPSAPVASYDTLGGTRHATSLHLYQNGDRLYMKTWNGGPLSMEIVDVSSPATVAVLDLPQERYGTVGEAKVRGDLAFMATGHHPAHNGGLLVPCPINFSLHIGNSKQLNIVDI